MPGNFNEVRRTSRVTRREERLRALEIPLPGGMSNLNHIIRFAHTGIWELYPVTAAGLQAAFSDLVDYDSIWIPSCTLVAPGGAWVIPDVVFSMFGCGVGGDGYTTIQGDFDNTANKAPLHAECIYFDAGDIKIWGEIHRCKVLTTGGFGLYITGSFNHITAEDLLLLPGVRADTHSALVDSTIIMPVGGDAQISDGIYVDCIFTSEEPGAAVDITGTVTGAVTFDNCTFGGAGAGFVVISADPASVRLRNCHLTTAFDCGVDGATYLDSCDWTGAPTNLANAEYTAGDRAIQDVAYSAAMHTSEVAAGVFTLHLPPPSLAGNIAIDSGAAWVSQPITGDATLAAGGALTVTGIGGVPSSAFWLLAGRNPGQTAYLSNQAGGGGIIDSTSDVTKGIISIAPGGGTVAIGSAPAGTVVLSIDSSPADIAGTDYGVVARERLTPGANFTTNVYGASYIAYLNANFNQTAGTFYGMECSVRHAAGITGTILNASGAYFDVRCGAGAIMTTGRSLHVYTPYVAAGGSMTTGFGMRIGCGTNAGTLTSLYGIYIDAINAGGTNYAIYSNAGLNRLGDQLSIVGSADRQQLTVTGYSTQAVAIAVAKVIRNDAAAGVSAILDLTGLGSGANGDGGSILLRGKSSTTAAQDMGSLSWIWTEATHASRTALLRGTATGNAANNGYFGHWNHDAVSNVALTIIPNATGDVTYVGTFMFSVYDNTNATSNGGTVTLNPGGGAVSLLSDGTDILQITCAADGSVTIVRSAGTHTFRVAIWGVWF